MLTINLQNVEELIFFNQAVQRALPELRNVFQTWSLGKRMPSLHFLCQKAVFEFFDSVTNAHIEKLSAIFDSEVKIVRTDPHLVKLTEFDLNSAEQQLNDMVAYENWFVTRDADKVYIGFWR